MASVRFAFRSCFLVPLMVASSVLLAACGSERAGDGMPEPVGPSTLFDPVAAGAPLPDGYRIGLARDQIEPIYEPEFTTADGVDWPLDSLVIGIAGVDEAKAYPVTHLNSREMVIDSLEGIPILVTW